MIRPARPGEAEALGDFAMLFVEPAASGRGIGRAKGGTSYPRRAASSAPR